MCSLTTRISPFHAKRFVSARPINRVIMDPFARQASQYVLSRPNYPKPIVEKVVAAAGGQERARSLTCLDVGCGSGQLTAQLAEHFGKVVGVDRSAPQLANAHKHMRIEYALIKDAVKLDAFVGNSFDCLTVAQTLHWLPLQPALQEFHRVLKPGGCFAAIGYGCCRVEQPAVQECFHRYYIDKLGSNLPLGDPRCLWDCDRTRLDTGHAAEFFEPPFTHIERIHFDDTRRVPNKDFVDYLKTWSAYQKLLQRGDVHALCEIENALETAGHEVDVTFPFWLVVGKKEDGARSGL